jgi:hypothetical protein
MNLLSKNRMVKADLKTFSLVDILNKLKKENFFTEEQPFYLIKIVNENHIIFGVPRNKVTPRQIHEFQYLEKENSISINSKYKNMFFPSFLIYGMPLIPMILGRNEMKSEDLKVFSFMLIGITLFISLFAFTSLNEDSKNIEREITLRLNYLLRQKGYRIKL